MFKGILGMFKGKMVQKENVVTTTEIFRGIWELDGNVVTGAYIRNGRDKLFVTERGVIVLPKIRKIELARATYNNDTWIIEGVNLKAQNTEKYIRDVLNCNCVPFLRLADA